jgi:hypothetical protein
MWAIRVHWADNFNPGDAEAQRIKTELTGFTELFFRNFVNPVNPVLKQRIVTVTKKAAGFLQWLLRFKS